MERRRHVKTAGNEHPEEQNVGSVIGGLRGIVEFGVDGAEMLPKQRPEFLWRYPQRTGRFDLGIKCFREFVRHADNWIVGLGGAIKNQGESLFVWTVCSDGPSYYAQDS